MANKLEPRKCEICGKEFVPKKSMDTMCCSKNCYTKRYRKMKPKEKIRKIGVCIICGKEYEQRKITQKCCSEECRGVLTKQQRKILNQKHNEKRKVKKSVEIPKTNAEKIAELEEEARKHGMRYGQYVAKMGL